MLQETGRFLCRGASPPKLILLVEDDPANAQLFLHILTQEASFRVFWASNGRAAWHFTQHVKPQLLLLEYSLPDMNAIILYDRLHGRKELEAVPALIVNASLKEGEDAIKQRGCWPWRNRSTWISSSLPLKASSRRLRGNPDGKGERYVFSCSKGFISRSSCDPCKKRQEHPGASRKENRNIWHNNVATSTRYVRSRRAPTDVRTV